MSERSVPSLIGCRPYSHILSGAPFGTAKPAPMFCSTASQITCSARLLVVVCLVLPVIRPQRSQQLIALSPAVLCAGVLGRRGEVCRSC